MPGGEVAAPKLEWLSAEVSLLEAIHAVPTS